MIAPRDIPTGTIAIVRFPDDSGGGCVSVAIVRAYRGDQALVAKRWGTMGRRWARPRWVPTGNIAREATKREAAAGAVIDAVPHFDDCPCTGCRSKAA